MLPVDKENWHATANITYITTELERTHLARSPQLLQELENINESWHEIGQPESLRLKQIYNVDI